MASANSVSFISVKPLLYDFLRCREEKLDTQGILFVFRKSVGPGPAATNMRDSPFGPRAPVALLTSRLEQILYGIPNVNGFNFQF